MNPDNPYAAPQTVASIANTAVALPMAEELPDPRGRILFPELSTAALARIEAASRAIRRMTIVWTVALALGIIGLVLATMSGKAFSPEWLLLVVAVVALGFRISAGVERGPSERYFSLVVELTPCLAVIYSVCQELYQWPQGRPIPGDAPLTLLFIVAILYMPMMSVWAHWRYSCLFGDVRLLHDDLARELTHRRKYRIS